MAKQILFDDNARAKMRSGIEKLVTGAVDIQGAGRLVVGELRPKQGPLHRVGGRSRACWGRTRGCDLSDG